jgi:hypothetical protein
MTLPMAWGAGSASHTKSAPGMGAKRAGSEPPGARLDVAAKTHFYRRSGGKISRA